MRGVSVGDAHGQGRSQDDLGIGGATQGRLPVAVVLGVETSGLPTLARDLRGGTSPQGPFILAPLVRHRAQAQAGPVS
jgi:hypothetical protein